MSNRRKNYTPEEKVAILNKHFVEKVSVSDLCDKYNLQPTVFYRWQKQQTNTRSGPHCSDGVQLKIIFL